MSINIEMGKISHDLYQRDYDKDPKILLLKNFSCWEI